MKDNLTPAQKVERAKVQLVLMQPFWASLALRLDFKAVPDEFFLAHGTMPTMATDGKMVYYSESFVEQIPLKQLMAVIAEEVGHVAFMHTTRRDWRHPLLWNFSCVAGETLILMADGSEKPISMIVPGDYVASPFGPNLVLFTVDSGENQVIELDINSCHELTCTGDHKILTEEGAVHAITCSDHALHGWVYREAASEAVRLGQLQIHEHEATFHGDAGILRGDFGVSSYSETAGQARKALLGPQKSGADLQTVGAAVGVPGRTGGRRRDRQLCLALEEVRQGQTTFGTILPASPSHLQHIVPSGRMAGGSGICPIHHEKLDRNQNVEADPYWLPNRRDPATVKAIPDHQGTAGRLSDALYRHSETAGVSSSAAFARNAGDISAGQGVEQARITLRKGDGGVRRTFDLVTEYHVYFANRILVHNCDAVIHPILKEAQFEVPEFAFSDKECEDKSAEQAYAILEKRWPPPPQSGPGDGKNKGQGKGKPGGKGDQPPEPGCGQVIDHGGSSAERSAHEQEWTVALEQAAQMAKAAGNLPASLERLVGEIKRPKIDWRAVLKRFFEDTVPKDFVWFPSNKRYVSSGIYLPSILKEGYGRVIISVDTSGSISQDQLAQFMGEINSIISEIKPSETYVIYCDTAIGRVDVFHEDEPIILQATGGGGTSFVAPFKYVEEHGLDPRCMIYLTDLQCSDYPAKEPSYPVMWVTEDPALEGRFGETLRMPPD